MMMDQEDFFSNFVYFIHKKLENDSALIDDDTGEPMELVRFLIV